MLISIRVDRHGHLANKAATIPQVVDAAGAGSHRCEGGGNPSVARAAGYWLMGREPVAESADEPTEINTRAVTLWAGLRRLPEPEAVKRAAEVRRAAPACEDLDGLLAGSAR
ncbi:hypothetical protein V6U90_22055 [Micromonospora sp. CPCC 206060]|uniref:hypothetical protein n=1 Tax=Micromonospora sp. CPCC 206060 TaxID=3122406 RepID=UPI002FEF5830